MTPVAPQIETATGHLNEIDMLGTGWIDMEGSIESFAFHWSMLGDMRQRPDPGELEGHRVAWEFDAQGKVMNLRLTN